MSQRSRSGVVGLVVALLVLPLFSPSSIARTIVVHPGDSIRAALGIAKPGDRVHVLPGVYREGTSEELNAISITTGGVELVGLSSPGRPVVLENAGRQSFGIWVSPPDSIGAGPEADPENPPCGLSGARIEAFSLSGFTVKGFAGDGVHITCVDGFSLRANVIDGNGTYGLFPVASSNGIMSGNEVMNTASDAGIYVGQSADVLISANHVHDNFLGIEVENSLNSTVIGNEVHANTLGILVDIMPFLQVRTQGNTQLSFNWVHDNNRPSTAEPGDLLGIFPPGIGILLTGADTTTINANTVTGNAFVGVGVVSVCLELALLGVPCDGLDIDPLADGNRIVGNVVRGNGAVPVADPLLDAFRSDLAWDGTGTGNCWSANGFGSSVPALLPQC